MKTTEKNERRTAQAKTSIQPALSAEIDRIAVNRKWSRAMVVYQAVLEYLARENKPR